MTEQTKLFSDIDIKLGKGFAEYGRRIVKQTRNGLLPKTPDIVIFSLATNQFLKHIKDLLIRALLLIRRKELCYYELVNEAETFKIL